MKKTSITSIMDVVGDITIPAQIKESQHEKYIMCYFIARNKARALKYFKSGLLPLDEVHRALSMISNDRDGMIQMKNYYLGRYESSDSRARTLQEKDHRRKPTGGSRKGVPNKETVKFKDDLYKFIKPGLKGLENLPSDTKRIEAIKKYDRYRKVDAQKLRRAIEDLREEGKI